MSQQLWSEVDDYLAEVLVPSDSALDAARNLAALVEHLKGAVADAASDDPSVQGIRRLHELIAAEPRVDATAFQTVGKKGYDGLTIALVTSG